jgi:hypothetical protein
MKGGGSRGVGDPPEKRFSTSIKRSSKNPTTGIIIR